MEERRVARTNLSNKADTQFQNQCGLVHSLRFVEPHGQLVMKGLVGGGARWEEAQHLFRRIMACTDTVQVVERRI